MNIKSTYVLFYTSSFDPADPPSVGMNSAKSRPDLDLGRRWPAAANQYLPLDFVRPRPAKAWPGR
jgi:hypothetical protein